MSPHEPGFTCRSNCQASNVCQRGTMLEMVALCTSCFCSKGPPLICRCMHQQSAQPWHPQASKLQHALHVSAEPNQQICKRAYAAKHATMSFETSLHHIACALQLPCSACQACSTASVTNTNTIGAKLLSQPYNSLTCPVTYCKWGRGSDE